MTASPIPSYRLSCADPDVHRQLSNWLDGTRLVWPGEFTLRVTVGDVSPFAPDSRESFPQADVGIQAGAPLDTVRLTWHDVSAEAEIHPSLPEADLWLSPRAVVNLPHGERSFLLVLLVFLMRRLGWYHVHGATLIDRQQRGWLIAGNSNCGKSTTTALMARNGWTVSTDDMAFVTRRGDRVVAMGVHSHIALRPGGQALLGAVNGIPLEARNKQGFWPEELGASWTPEVTPRIIAFPAIGERTSMTRARPRYALSNVIKWSHWVLYEPVFADEHLDVLGALAAQSACYDLTLGPDLFDRPQLLEELSS